MRNLFSTLCMGMVALSGYSVPTTHPVTIIQSDPTIYGSVVFGHLWEDMGQNTPYGIYSLPANDADKLKNVVLDNKLTAFGGGVYVDGRYYLVDYSPYNYDGTICFRTYDVDSGWKLIEEKRLTTYNSVASDLTYDPSKDCIYGCFREGATSDSYFLGTLNPNTGMSTYIGKLDEELIALASTKDGLLYGIGAYGMLYSVNKTTGQLTAIGQTGKTVKYAQSATIDYPSGRMFWAMTPHYTDENPEICEVNLATGSVTTLTTIPDRYQFTGIYTTGSYAEDDAPQRVNNLKATFTEGSLSGIISFNMPSWATNGTSLSGSLGYNVFVDQREIASGNASVGANKSTELTLTRGMHYIKVWAKNNVGRSPIAYYDVWVGADVVDAQNPKVEKTTSGDIKVSWTAPKKGVHGGWFNAQDVTYRVTRQPDKTVVYEGNATSFTDASATSLQVGNYRYDVEAKVAGEYGNMVSTDIIQIGTALNLPYLQNFDDAVSASSMIVEDTNNDGETWQFFGDCYICGISETGVDDNDWIFTPVFNLSKDSVYQVSVDAKAEESYKEVMTIAMGNKAESTAMSQTILPATELDNFEYRTFGDIFVPQSDGACHIGIHATSKYAEGSYLYIDNLSVKTVGSVKAPAAATDVKAEPLQTNRQVHITFNAPSVDLQGNPLRDNIRQIEIYRTSDNAVVKTFSNVSPGKKCEFTDDVSADGSVSYEITPANGYGKGRSSHISTYVGLDTPSAVTDLRISATDDGKVSTSWKAPEKGIHGGIIDNGSLKYNVSGIGGSTLRSTVVEKPSFDDQLTMSDDKQQLAWYVVTAETEQGKSPELSTDTIFVGKPYTLPYTESFARRSLQKGPWCPSINELAEWDIMLYGSYADAADMDNGLIAFSTITPGASADFIGPKLSLRDTDNPQLTFYSWNMKRSVHNLRVTAITPNGERIEIANFVPNDYDTDGNEGMWRKYTYSLSSMRQYDYIQIMFTGTGGDIDDLSSIVPLYVDLIKVEDLLSDNITVESLEPIIDKANVGNELSFALKMKNTGSADANDFNVNLYRNDVLVGTTHVDNLAEGYETELTLTDVPNGDVAMSSQYYAVVSYDADQDESDNTSNKVSATILPGKPFVEDAVATGSTGSSQVVLSWQEPPCIDRGTKQETVCEDFESYTPFTIRHFGEWSLNDVDGATTLGIQDGTGNFVQYDNVESPMAYQIFNPSAAGISSTLYPTHSGKQVAAAFSSGRFTANDDWLISPEVDGAQTIKFWACSPDSRYYGTQEQIEVLYSSESTQTSSFKKIGSTLTIPSVWTEYSAELPANTRYFAIRCTSKDQYILFLDDITYRKAARDFRLLGYNVYLNGQKLNTQPLTQTSYVHNATPSQTDTYGITAVYNIGESRIVNTTWRDPSEIESVNGDSLSEETKIYDITGRQLPSISQEHGGIYIIKKGNRTQKVHIK